jgi:hypothetical protein
MQIIESKRLPEKEYLWLTHLDKEIGGKRLSRILKEHRKLRKRYASYFYALMLANQQSLEEMEESPMSRAAVARMFEEMGFHQQWETRGVQKGIHGTLRVIQGLKNAEPAEQLAKETGLPLEAIEQIQSELGER